jgi:hypothetical protein
VVIGRLFLEGKRKGKRREKEGRVGKGKSEE